MRTVTRLSQAAAVAALGLSLAACGSSSSSGNATSAASQAATSAASSAAAPETSASSATEDNDAAVPDAKTLIHEARKAVATAESAELHADVTDAGEHQTIDIKGTVDGSNQDATASRGKQGTATVRTVDGTSYIKGDQQFWTNAVSAPETTAALLADKWVTAPKKTATSLKSLTIQALLGEAIGPENISDAELEQATSAKTTYDGQDAYVVTSARTKNTITVAADTKLVLEINGEQGSSSSKGKMTLTGWNDQPRIEAPDNPVTFPQSAK